MGNNLRKLAYDLDDRMSQIGAHVTTIDHVSTMLMHVKEDMDEAVYKGEEKMYFHQNHRTVHVLSELMFLLMRDMKKNYEDLHNIRGEMFHQIVNGEQEKTSTTCNSEGSEISPSN